MTPDRKLQLIDDEELRALKMILASTKGLLETLNPEEPADAEDSAAWHRGLIEITLDDDFSGIDFKDSSVRNIHRIMSLATQASNQFDQTINAYIRLKDEIESTLSRSLIPGAAGYAEKGDQSND